MSFIFGYNTVGGTANSWGVDRKCVCLYPLTEVAVVSRLSVYLFVAAGSTLCKAVIYSDSGGAPDALLGESAQVTIPEVPMWYDFIFTAPVTLVAGSYWLGFIYEGANAPNFYLDAGAADQFAYNNDVYSNGAADPFGAPSYFAWKISIYATYTLPIPEWTLTVQSSPVTDIPFTCVAV